MSGPYASSALDYWRAGHRGALYLPPAKKGPPPVGYTGWGGRWPSMADIAGWVEDHPNGNIALRPDEETLGFDVDDYEPKKGGETIGVLEAELGPLPATVSSTSRGFGVSRIRFYRVPAGLAWRDDLVDIELIHYGHRYAVVWPSVHDKTGELYVWYDEDGQTLEEVPDFSNLPKLPDPWVEYLEKGEGGGAHKVDADDEKLKAWYQALPTGEPCEPVADRLAEALEALASQNGSRHNAQRGAVASLIGYGANGHKGVPTAISQVREAFFAASTVPGPGQRTPAQAKAEWKRSIAGAMRMQLAEHPEPDDYEPCWYKNAVIKLPAAPTGEPIQLTEAVSTFRRWLHLPDPDHIIAALGAVAANRLHGDPVWILFVGPAGSGKTEAIQPLAALDYVHMAATLTEPALLSGVPKKAVESGATGGLLRQVGSFGILLVKDFSGVLSMHRDQRSAVLAALREIFDGSWSRPVGTAGGRVLHWAGHCGILGAVTPSIDRHSAVMGALGERFVLYRLTDDTSQSKADRALGNFGDEEQMRAELRGAVHGVLGNVEPTRPDRLDDDERRRLVNIAEFAVRARSAVERDGYSRVVVTLPEYEHATRLAKQLAQLRAGILAVGADDTTAWRIITKAALDSIPRLRWRILEVLRDAEYPLKTGDLIVATDIPKKTLYEHLEDLELLRLIEREKTGSAANSPWVHRLAESVREAWPRKVGEKRQGEHAYPEETLANAEDPPPIEYPQPVEDDNSRPLWREPTPEETAPR